MFNAPLPEPKLLKVVLQPLLEDFQLWFGQTEALLDAGDLSFLDASAQVTLLARVRTARQEVSTAQALLNATEGQTGVEPAVLAPWHQLVLECWQVSLRVRRDRSGAPSASVSPFHPSQSSSVAFETHAVPLPYPPFMKQQS